MFFKFYFSLFSILGFFNFFILTRRYEFPEGPFFSLLFIPFFLISKVENLKENEIKFDFFGLKKIDFKICVFIFEKKYRSQKYGGRKINVLYQYEKKSHLWRYRAIRSTVDMSWDYAQCREELRQLYP